MIAYMTRVFPVDEKVLRLEESWAFADGTWVNVYSFSQGLVVEIRICFAAKFYERYLSLTKPGAAKYLVKPFSSYYETLPGYRILALAKAEKNYFLNVYPLTNGLSVVAGSAGYTLQVEVINLAGCIIVTKFKGG